MRSSEVRVLAFKREFSALGGTRKVLTWKERSFAVSALRFPPPHSEFDVTLLSSHRFMLNRPSLTVTPFYHKPSFPEIYTLILFVGGWIFNIK